MASGQKGVEETTSVATATSDSLQAQTEESAVAVEVVVEKKVEAPRALSRALREPPHCCQFCGAFPAPHEYSIWNYRISKTESHRLCDSCKAATTKR